MLSKALREYGTVSAEPITDGHSPPHSVFSTAAARAGVDVRRFPWIRPLPGDYAYNFPKSRRSMPATRRPRPGATRSAASSGIAAIAAAIAAVLAAQQERRAARRPRPARRRRSSRIRDRRDRHRPAGRRVRRTAVHPPQGGHRASSSRAASPSEHGVPAVADLLGGRGGSRLGGSRRVYGARRRVPAENRHPPPPEGAGDLPVAALHARRAHRPKRSTSSPPPSPTTEFTESVIAGLREAYGRASAWPTRSRAGSKRLLGPYGLVVFESSDPGGEAARRRRVRARAAHAGPHGCARRRGGRSARAVGHAPQVVPQRRQRLALPPRRRPPTDPPPGRSRSRSATTPSLARDAVERGASRRRRLQSERAAAADRAGHALPDHLLRGGAERAGVSRPAARRV